MSVRNPEAAYQARVDLEVALARTNVIVDTHAELEAALYGDGVNVPRALAMAIHTFGTSEALGPMSRYATIQQRTGKKELFTASTTTFVTGATCVKLGHRERQWAWLPRPDYSHTTLTLWASPHLGQAQNKATKRMPVVGGSPAKVYIPGQFSRVAVESQSTPAVIPETTLAARTTIDMIMKTSDFAIPAMDTMHGFVHILRDLGHKLLEVTQDQ